MLVYLVMIAHPNPKQVEIIYRGEGTTLLEILKHNIINEVVMVKINKGLVGLCWEHLPKRLNYTDIVVSYTQ